MTPIAADLLPSTQRALLHRLAVEQAKRAPSMAAALVRDGRVVWSGGRGRVDGAPPTTDTQYRIGSITKTFVGVMVMRLRDEGKVELDAPFERYVPGTKMGELTVAQLMSHSSGITAESPGVWWERSQGGTWSELSALVGDEEKKHRAGRRYHYSNLGFGALGELVARVRGTSWLEAVKNEILDPLGMKRTTPTPVKPHADGWAVHPWADVLLPEPAHDAGAMGPAGQLWSTLDDLARWVRFVCGDTGGVLRPDTVAEMREPAIVDDGDHWVGGYGLGLQLARNRGRRLAGHTGSMPGFLATVWAHAEGSTGAVVFANTTTGVEIPVVAADLIDIVETQEPRIPAEWAPAAEDLDPALLELTGPWYWGPAPRILRVTHDGWLHLGGIGQPAGRTSRFRPQPDGTWIGLDGYYAGETLRVVRGAGGSVSHLELATFIFTRRPYDPGADVPGGVDPGGWRAVPPPPSPQRKV